MNRFIPITAAAFLAAAAQAAAQPASVSQSGSQSGSPSSLGSEQVRSLQRTLNKDGFSSGHVDGIWGPDTETALRNFQRQHHLPRTGQPDEGTMAALGLAAGGQAAPPPMAQAQPAIPAQDAPTNRTPGPAVTALPNGAASPAGASAGSSAGALPTATRGNPAVATTAASDPVPAAGANSFSEGEARNRIAAHGFAGVANLQKGANGVWRGTATRNGQPVNVWLDFKGDVGVQ